MKIHVLSGDSLVKPFAETGIEGEVFVCRECCVDGPLAAEDLEEFWALREDYLTRHYGAPDPDYSSKVVEEFSRLWGRGDGNEVVLWFEYELFCQVNLWFTVWLMRNTDAHFSIAYPKLNEGDGVWKGFSELSEKELIESFESRVKLSHDDVFLAVGLWETFQNRDFDALGALADTKSPAFPTLGEIVKAACAIETRPVQSLQEIIKSGKTEFGPAFQEFCEKEAVYGFGDLQVQRIFDGIITGDG